VAFYVVVAVVIAAVWTALSRRARRRNPDWSPKRDLVVLGITAAITVFLAVPISPKHGEVTRSLGYEVALWTATWLVLAGVIRLLTLIGRPHRRSPQAPDGPDA
jgi:amino acid transporter